MPSCPVHLKAAFLLCDKLGIENKPDFFLGSIAPDCVNLDGFASQEIRYGAHIRVVNPQIWKSNMKKFYEENKFIFKDNSDFLKGYLFHCFTDVSWDECIQPKLFAFLDSLGISDEEKRQAKWEELYRFNGVLVNENWYNQALDYVSKGTPQNIATVTAQQIDAYRNYIINDYKDKTYSHPPAFLNSGHIDEVCQYMLKSIRETPYKAL